MKSEEAVKVMLKNYPDVLDVNDVSDILGVSKKTVYGFLKTNKIRYIKAGRAYRSPKICLV